MKSSSNPPPRRGRYPGVLASLAPAPRLGGVGALLSLVLGSACASTGATVLDTHAPAPQLVLSTDRGVQRSFPERRSDARLPTADRQRLGTHTAAVRLCVAPDGSVHSLDVTRSSGSARFDAALTSDLARWQFEPYAAPAGLKVCEQVTVSYLAD